MDSLLLLPCLDSGERAARCRADLLIPWERTAELGRTAVTAAETGGYRDAAGRLVDWGDGVARARAAKRSLPPEAQLPDTGPAPFPHTRVQVVNETTLVAARRLTDTGACLTGCLQRRDGIASAPRGGEAMTDRYPTPPKNLMAFAHRFATDERCAEYLFELRHPDGYVCPKCGSTKAWSVAEKPGMMICDRGHKISVTAGTAMHRTKLPLHLWFYAAWLLATLKPGISAVQLQRQLGISRLETAWTLLHKLRAAMYAPGRERLSSFCSKDYHADH
jgi:hypothetical protein